MEHRKFRHPTFFDALLCAESGDYKVKVRNLTADGVNVAGLGGIVFPESEVRLVVRDRDLTGRVSWVHEDVAGIRLDAPMPKDLEKLIGRKAGRAGLKGAARW